MKTWEYDQRSYRVVDPRELSTLVPETREGLNAMGQQGWEVMHMSKDIQQFHVWFKRPVWDGQIE